MDRITDYHQIIERIIADYLEYIPKESDTETIAISDDKSGIYLLLQIGWLPTRRIHSVYFHLRISARPSMGRPSLYF